MNLISNNLLLRWVIANSLSETIGLGATFGVGYFVFGLIGDPQGITGLAGGLLLLVVTGSIEGLVVGLGQWWAMHPFFPGILRRSWVIATLVGALIAWFLGSLPSTIMGMGSENVQSASVPEPEQWVVLLLAGGMGVLLGPVLAIPQFQVMKKSVKKAAWWIPANSAAWFFGMPVIFWVVDKAFNSGNLAGGILVIVAGLAITGAIVGAVHGLVLVWLYQSNIISESNKNPKLVK